ncbi:hypothetical protein cypCar_00040901 [Cyprinus carpio]|nr:hypothetical protein cypCar_00040901 [Cyprinus carpio]
MSSVVVRKDVQFIAILLHRMDELGVVKRESRKLINAEFLRITTLPLQSRFMASLDRQSSQLLQVIRSKGGVLREKTKDTIKVMDQSLDIDIRREGLLKCLITYLGEDASCLIKEYQLSLWVVAVVILWCGNPTYTG